MVSDPTVSGTKHTTMNARAVHAERGEQRQNAIEMLNIPNPTVRLALKRAQTGVSGDTMIMITAIGSVRSGPGWRVAVPTGTTA
jgi:hypothetical protein